MRRLNVFINIPFDSQYEPLYIALIVGLVGIGLIPRSSLEVPIVTRGGRRPRGRLRRIFELLRSCEFSLHDLSRVQLSSSAPRCPRFNMPFEAGLAVALSWSGNKNRWYILEARDYRLQKSLSDLNGHDPFIHGGSVQGVLVALTDIFPGQRHQPDPTQLLSLYRRVRKASAKLKRSYRNNLFGPSCFRQLIAISQLMARRAGYIP